MPFPTLGAASLATELTYFSSPLEGHHFETSTSTADLNNSIQDCEGPLRGSFDKAVPNGHHQTESCSTVPVSASEHSHQEVSIDVNYLDLQDASSRQEMDIFKSTPPHDCQYIQPERKSESAFSDDNTALVAVTPTCLLSEYTKAKSGELQDCNPCEVSKPVSILVAIDHFSCAPNVELRLEELRCAMMMSLIVPNFIPLRAKASLLKSNDDSFPLEDKVLHFLGPNKRQVLLLSGEAGSGKTTFCSNLVRNLWIDYRPGGRIPLFIDLPVIDKPQSGLIYKHLRQHNFLDHEIHELLRKRQFLLVCDGYDESSLTTNLHSSNCLNQPGQPQVKMVVTCRSTFFGRHYRDRFYPYGSDKYHGKPPDLFEEAMIVPLTKVDVETFIQQYIRDAASQKTSNPRLCWTLKQYMYTFSIIDGLSELVRTPFLLWLAVTVLPSLPSGALDSAATIKVTRAQLYDRFLCDWIVVSKTRLHSITLDPTVSAAFDELCGDEVGFEGLVMGFLTELAKSIYENQGFNPIVDFDPSKDGGPWKGDFFGKGIRATLLRDASPLSRVQNRYMFLYRSFFAYFRSLAFCNYESGDEDDSDGDEDDDPDESGDGDSGGAGLSDNGGSARGFGASSAGGSELSGGNGGSKDMYSGSSGSDGDSSGGNRDATDDHQGTFGGGGGSPGGSGSSGGSRGNSSGGGRDDSYGDKNNSRPGKDGSRFMKKNRTKKSRPFTSSHPFSKENIFNDSQVLEFLVDRVHSDPRFKKHLLATIDKSKSSSLLSLAAANAIMILFMSGERFLKVNLNRVQVPCNYMLEIYPEQLGCLTGLDLVSALLALEIPSATHTSNLVPQPTTPPFFESHNSDGIEPRTSCPSSTPTAIVLTRTHRHIDNEPEADSLLPTTAVKTTPKRHHNSLGYLYDRVRKKARSDIILAGGISVATPHSGLQSLTMSRLEQHSITVESPPPTLRAQRPIAAQQSPSLLERDDPPQYRRVPSVVRGASDYNLRFRKKSAQDSSPRSLPLLDLELEMPPIEHTSPQLPSRLDIDLEMISIEQTSPQPPSWLDLDLEMTSIEHTLLRLRSRRLGDYNQPIYIPVHARPTVQSRDDTLFPLMDKVQEFLESDGQVMLLLGDSGAGKSAFYRHLEHELWQRYKPGDSIPLFINLPNVKEPKKELIPERLRSFGVSEEQIQELKQGRHFFLICDGYDQCKLTYNLHTTNHLNQSDQWSAKLLITCRTQYLGSDYRNMFVPQGTGAYDRSTPDLLQEAVIAPFTKEQIERYVDMYIPMEPRTWSTEDYMNSLTTIPNLMDLVKNPLLLSLALEVLPGVTDGTKGLATIKITRVQLYDMFVQHWFEVIQQRLQNNSALSSEDRCALVQLVSVGFVSLAVEYSTKLAQAIFDKQDGNQVVQYSHFNDKNTWKTEFFKSLPEVRLVRDSSPLTRTGSQFRFIHRSILEYFYSCAIYDPIKYDAKCGPETKTGSTVSQLLDASGPLFQRDLVQEPSVISFLCDRVKLNPGFKHQLCVVIERSKIDAGSSIAAANAITILVRSGMRFNSTNLQGIKIQGANLTGGEFDSADLRNADLRNTSLEKSWLRGTRLERAKLEAAEFGELAYVD